MQIINSPSAMVRKMAILFLGLFAMVNISMAQVNVSLSDGSADPGQTVDIDVTLDNFTDIILFQFSINWDETQFSFNSIQNVTTVLEQFSAAASIGSPSNGGDPGEITVSWSKANTQPETLPGNTVLFTIRLNAIGAACDQSTIRLSNNPTTIEFVDSNTADVGAVADNGDLMINGTDCNGSGGTLTATIPDVSGDNGSNVCIPVNVTDFTNISSMTFNYLFDPAVLSYTETTNGALTGFDGAANVFEGSPGNLSIFWFDNTGQTPETVTGKLFDVCFDVIGSGGQTSDLEILESSAEFTVAPDDQALPFILNDGSFTVNNTGTSDDFTLISGDATIPMGGTSCVPISVENFVDIQSIQVALMWDADVLIFSNTQNFNLTQLDAGKFAESGNNKLRLSWNNLTGGTNVADGTVIFEVCFEGTGDCDATTEVMFTSDPPIPIEVSNGSNEVVPVNFEVGTSTVECDGCSIAIRNLQQPTCNGETDGSIEVNLGSGTFSCTWTDGSGATIQSGNDCDIFNLGAGTYTLTIDDGAGCNESREFVLAEPSAIVFGGTKQDIMNDCDGSISLQMSGGAPPYAYLWEDGSTGSIRTELCAGEYCVTVTDNSNCTAENCFTIQPDGLSAMADITSVRCFGDATGAIDITVVGGAPDYTFNWEGPSGTFTTEDISDLSAGTYNLTITDAGSLEFIMSYVVTQPDEITIMESITASDGNNGSIDITVTGGTPPYSFAWSPGGETTEDLSGLAPGDYSVLVTDDNNCNVMSDVFSVNSTSILFNLGASTSPNCFDECDGVIDGTITGGTGTYTFTLNGDAVEFPVRDLCAGEYTLMATDGDGLTASESITLTNPEELTFTINKTTGCVEPGETTGFIEINASGGTGGYTYLWNIAGTGSDQANLASGTYGVLVTDDNGCQLSDNDILIDSCEPPVPCFTHSTVISPNGDDFNNEFVIACATSVENTLRVYDRWGAPVFEMVNYDNTWTGLSNTGDELPEGGYMWVLEVTNDDGSRELKRGTVTILRDQF